MIPVVNGKFVLPDVPFRCGTEVRPKRGPDAQFVWTVYDHHGVSWPEGEDVARVVLVRGLTEAEILSDRDPEWARNDTRMKVTTWGRIEAAT
jgi:hypothetical protein